MDVVSLYQSGVRNVSASLGTALTENQARLIKRYTKNVILSYDADQAGQNAAMRGLDILYRENCRARVLKVTDGKDPDEFMKKNGRKAFLQLIDNALPYGDFKLGFCGSSTIWRTAAAGRLHGAAVDVLRGMKPVEADIYIRKLAEETGVSEGAIRFEYSGNNTMEKGYAGRAGTSESAGSSGRRKDEMPLIEQDLIKLMLLDGAFIRLPEDIKDEAFKSSSGRNIYECIVAAVAEDGMADAQRVREMLDEEDAELFEEIESGNGACRKERLCSKTAPAKIRRKCCNDRSRS